VHGAPNKAHSANPAMTSLLHAGRNWRGVADARRKGVSPEYLHKSGCSVGFGHAPRVAHRVSRRDLPVANRLQQAKDKSEPNNQHELTLV
jgi:hypothetical protein